MVAARIDRSIRAATSVIAQVWETKVPRTRSVVVAAACDLVDQSGVLLHGR